MKGKRRALKISATAAAASTAILNYHTDREMERVKADL